MAISTEIIGKIGGGQVETTAIGETVGGSWYRLATITVESQSLVVAYAHWLYSASGEQWGNPSPTIRVRPADGRAGEPSITEFWAGLSGVDETIDYSLHPSVAAPLPPGEYAVEMNSSSSGRAAPVEYIHTAVLPLA